MIIKNDAELEALKEIGLIVAEVLYKMGLAVEPGISTRELDAMGLRWLTEAGAQSAPQAVYKFPGATCISINHRVAHGIPDKTCLRAGDLVNIDVSAVKNSFFGDTGSSFCVPPAQPKRAELCRIGREILDLAIAEVSPGRPVNIIGKTISHEAQKRGYTVIRNLGSHGVGRSLHEEPSFIAPYYDANDNRMLKAGMVITIEPFVSTGGKEVKQERDGWTLSTHKRYDTVQYEHSMVIQEGGALILTPVPTGIAIPK